MADRYNEFVHLQNLKNFEKKLETETDPVNRDQLLKLLAQEKAGTLPHPATPKS
jgi:hypothetical protein